MGERKHDNPKLRRPTQKCAADSAELFPVREKRHHLATKTEPAADDVSTAGSL
jgi:hypothetical protein